ncbi:phosphosulfolactate synthase [Methanofervidicoccus sp. A16]|uniref:phosphosulfolactate synthase n=1 Tax=Methanofervidicoccus sp. A16 TaxID=2607662 RepID=UPI00118AE491|nr:phosphosulfolactate synthase [Methanofervidicoccus sp. A16]AXI25462.1 phosphosulfolactate synthase [Methanofervidicoccus sp. A16]
MRAFEFLRESKEKLGITMVLDKGLPPEFLRDYLRVCGEYITFVKFGWGTSAVIDRDIVKEKIKIYKKYGIKTYPGGTLFEVAYSKGLFEEYLRECEELGFETVEISDGSINLSLEEREEVIRRAKERGFTVLTEVGKKSVEMDRKITLEERIELINRDIDVGADYVIVEGRESGKSIGLFDSKGNVKEEEFKTLINSIPLEKVIFEAPQKNQQVYFILNIGPDVNLGNIPYEDVISLETLRRGLRGDTFGKV